MNLVSLINRLYLAGRKAKTKGACKPVVRWVEVLVEECAKKQMSIVNRLNNLPKTVSDDLKRC
jgi:hypothetical protein